jgi:phospholipase/carboxylesterase
MNDLLETVVVGPEDATHSVIWLHGLGADGYDFEPIVLELNFTHKDKTRFVFPHAPTRPVTINNGYVMRAWYDIVAIDKDTPVDEEGIRQSESQLHDLIAQENQRGVDSTNIVLAGFSQGGAIALHTGLHYSQPLAGIMALSTYLPMPDKLIVEASECNRGISIFMAHGLHDPVVPFALAEDSRAFLSRNHYSVEWHTYPMDHSVVPQEIDDISRWLNQLLA